MNLFDVIIIVVLVLFTVLGARRGLIMTLCGLVTAILALVGAQFVADNLTPTVAQMIQPAIQSSIQQSIDEALDTEPETESEASAALKEGGVLAQIFDSEVYQEFSQSIQESIDQGIQEATSGVAESMAVSLSCSIAWLVLYVVAFGVILVLGNLAARVLNVAARLPGLHFLNKSLGGVCGLVRGLVIVAVVCSLGSCFGLISQESIQNSLLLETFASFTTFSL
ncbi:MAG: CvpA family protein [Clostridiales bacterium]|nr:CvpA family protein [Clostridiales bacterium]